MEDHGPQCARCTVVRCASKEEDRKVPSTCPTEKYPDLVKEATEKFLLPENQAVHCGWLGFMSKVMDPARPRERLAWTRVDEVMEYARVRGMKRLGIATCYALLPESRALTEILETNDFEVVSVSCLCGEVNPQDVGMPGKIFCNPIMQAEVLNREKTHLNMMVGLCVGHDILFLRYSKAETTPLVVKDRALGHNPVAALYLSQSPVYRDRFSKR